MNSIRGAAAARMLGVTLAATQLLGLTLVVVQPAPAHAQARRLKRGDMLPAEVLRSGPNVDYAAQHLRRPPDGYGWFALSGQVVLASLSSGLVLEVVG